LDSSLKTWSGGGVEWFWIALIGAAVGFLGGVFGKGGAAVATPLLAAIGLPPLVALASPLPATIPGALVAHRRYRRLGISDPQVVRWSVAFGVPATVIGALASHWIGGRALVELTDAVVALVGLRILLSPDAREIVRDVPNRPLRLAGIAVAAGFLAGLLGNGGGFLLVPLYLAVLRLPIKTALACSLAVASVLAVPGSAVHAALGHIDWTVTVVFAGASIPLSSLGAKTALRIGSARLERVYGLSLLVLGTTFLVMR
jgi:uncharacterized membrane protein YfcA